MYCISRIVRLLPAEAHPPHLLHAVIPHPLISAGANSARQSKRAWGSSLSWLDLYISSLSEQHYSRKKPKVNMGASDKSTAPVSAEGEPDSSFTATQRTFKNLTIIRHPGNVFVLTMCKPPENRLNTVFAQTIISALRHIESSIGPDALGPSSSAVPTTSSGARASSSTSRTATPTPTPTASTRSWPPYSTIPSRPSRC